MEGAHHKSGIEWFDHMRNCSGKIQGVAEVGDRVKKPLVLGKANEVHSQMGDSTAHCSYQSPDPAGPLESQAEADEQLKALRRSETVLDPVLDHSCGHPGMTLLHAPYRFDLRDFA